jgi:hypothetical protein
MNLFKVIPLLFLGLLTSCSIETLSGGNGTGTDAGEAKIVGQVTLPDNKTGNNVKVTLRQQDYLPQSLNTSQQRTTVTGSNGSFAMNRIKNGYYLIELWNDDSLCAIRRFFIPDDTGTIDLGDVPLDTQTQFYGKVLTDGVPASGALLLVMGTDKVLTIAEDGSFSLPLPAAGDQVFRVNIEKNTITSDFLFSSSNVGDTIVVQRTPQTIFEDFNRKDSCNNLHNLLGGGWWFAYKDSGIGGNSQVVPTSELGLVAAMDTTPNAYSGGSLHVLFQIDSVFSSPYALIGADISGSKDSPLTGRSAFDMSNMTALTFMAKGSGTIYLQLTCMNPVDPRDFYLFELPVTLTSSWQHYSITPEEIPNAKSMVTSTECTWTVGSSTVNNITFLAKKSADFWVDDIIVEGMNPTDFVKNQ